MLDKSLFYNNSKLDKNRLRETWVRANISEFTKIKVFQQINNQEYLKFSQVLYNYLNLITELPKCMVCNLNLKRFIGFHDGYNNFCSKSCALKNSSEKIVNTRRRNTFEKWGVLHTSQLDTVKQKQSITNTERYGYKSPSLNERVKEKQKATMVDRYGVEYSGQSKELLAKSMQTRFDNYMKHIIERYQDLDIVKVPEEGLLEICCSKCNQIYEIRTELLSLRHFRYKVNPCLFCNPISSYKYSAQNEIALYLIEKGFELEMANRKILNGKEVDIFIPSKKIAIEFNGLYWHSDLYKPNDYHLQKKINCEQQGINLIHIWEDDWTLKKEIVISRLNNLLGIEQKKIWARNCQIREISSKDCLRFYKDNHLQGSVNAKYNYGLFLNNELVSAMSFGGLRRSLGQSDKLKNYELYRFCCKVGHLCIGGFSKLLKYFISKEKPSEIVTYANRDWSTLHNVYERNGFTFDSFTKMNYWYFNKNLKRHHRFQFRKDKITKDKTKTEKSIMSEMNYHRVFDCGSIKYRLIVINN